MTNGWSDELRVDEFETNLTRRMNIKRKVFVGVLSVLFLCSCATMRDSLIVGAGTGAVMGGAIGSQLQGGDPTENLLTGAVVGAVVGGVTSYLIYGSLESRDQRVRKETLLNLEKYDVLGRDAVTNSDSNKPAPRDKCYTTREVDGRLMSIPCRYVDDPNDSGAK